MPRDRRLMFHWNRMERKSVQALTLIIVATLAACAGFIAGSRVGIRELTILKAQNATLSADVTRVSERLSKIETISVDLIGQLEHAQSELDRLHVATELPEAVVDCDERSTPLFHSQMTFDLNSFEAQQRIVELECEVASLKEFVGSKTAMSLDGQPPKSSPASTELVKAVDSPATKEKCTTITQKGVRCSRLARSNGKCWQHGG